MDAHEVQEVVRAGVRAVGGNQADLARRARVTQSTVSRWVSGQAMPDFESCLVLAEITGYAPDYLLQSAGHDPARLRVVRASATEDQREQASAPKVAIDPRRARLISIVRDHVPDEDLTVLERMLAGYRLRRALQEGSELDDWRFSPWYRHGKLPDNLAVLLRSMTPRPALGTS